MERYKFLKGKATDAGQASWESSGHGSELPVTAAMTLCGINGYAIYFGFMFRFNLHLKKGCSMNFWDN